MENFALDLKQGDENLEATGKLHWRWRRDNFVANLITGMDYRNLTEGSTSKRLSMEYARNNFHLSWVENQKQGESWKNWLGES